MNLVGTPVFFTFDPVDSNRLVPAASADATYKFQVAHAGTSTKDTVQAISPMVHNATGQPLYILIGGSHAAPASTTNWHYKVADGERMNLPNRISQISVFFPTSASVIEQGTAGATFAIWGFPEGTTT